MTTLVYKVSEGCQFDAKAAIKEDDWNQYKIVVEDNRYRSWINGIPAAGFTDHVDSRGFIGLQVHAVD